MLTQRSTVEVQSVAASVIARHGGTVTASSPTVTSATFHKPFSWVWCLLTFVAVYVVYYLVSNRTQTLTITQVQAEGGTLVTFTASGGKATKAGKAVLAAL
jgi:hypothetical protein